jgi:hypothetical protein
LNVSANHRKSNFIMRSILILTALFFSVASLSAQIPVAAKTSTEQHPGHGIIASPDNACNAGTFHFGTHTGQSNDVGGAVTYLCKNDVIQLIGDGNATFMDPQPGSAPGVGYAFYKCSPTVSGPDLDAIVADPCVLNTPPPADYLWLTTGLANGNHTFSNTGNLQNQFNMMNPLQLWFAPITVDDFANNTYEQSAASQPFGPCTNVNLAEKFSVVYLNEITVDGISANAGNDCIGKFRIRGGLPQFDISEHYTIEVFLTANPTVKALIHTPPQAIGHNVNVFFSVTQSGPYTVLVKDSKGCAAATASVNMTSCNSSDNAVLNVPNVVAPTGTNVCVPINVSNFAGISSFGFNISWDPALLQYNNMANPNPDLLGFIPANFSNELQTPQGNLYLFYYINPTAVPLNIPNGEALIELCFTVLGPTGTCSPIQAGFQPGVVSVEDATGNLLALTLNAGSVCAGALGALTTTATPHDTCNADGSISIKVTGGTPPYDVTWIGPSGASSGGGTISASGSSLNPSGLEEGAYTILVFDNTGLSDTITTALVINDLGGGTNGSVKAKVIFNNITVNNPGANYTFTWDPAVPTNSQILTGLGAGTYKVTVTNNSEGCNAVASGTLSQPAPISQANLVVIPASCKGVSNGSISILAAGGVSLSGGDYKFNWAYSSTQTGTKTPLPALTATTNPAVANMLQVGFYHVTITDANMCSATDVIEILADKVISFDPATVTDASCFGKKDGELNIQFSTNPITPVSVSAWDYSPKPVGSTAVPGLSSYLVSNLPVGNYIVSATDADGCKLQDTFEVKQPIAIAISPNNLINPTCVGVTNGVISIKPPSGGVPPFTYKWNDANASTTQNLQNIPQGTYTVTVTDGNGCTNSAPFTIALPASPVVSIDSTSVKCGADGCLKATGAGPGLSYLWVNLTTQTTVGTTPQVCNLAGGQYVYAVTNADQCTTADTITLGGKIGVFFSDTNYQKPSCFGLDDGFLGITVLGGTSPYNYDWNPTQTNTPLAFNITAGTYKVTVTDNNDCTLEGEFTLLDPPAINVDFNNIQAALCNNTCDGEVEVVATYATVPPTQGVFTYGWSDQPNLNNANRTNLCAGAVSVTVRDANNCFVIQELVISSPPPVIADTFYTIPARCDGDSNGSAFVTGSGGNGGPYSYDWGPYPSLQMITDLEAGQYTVTITDKKECSGTKTLVVLDPEPVVAVIDSSATEDVICNGGDSGQIGLQISGGNTGVFSFLWTNGVDTVGNTGFIDQLVAGTYLVTVTDSKGCTGDAGPFTLSEPPPVRGAYLEWEALLCFGDQTTVNVDTVWGGVGGPYQFSVDFGVALDVDFPVSVGGGDHVISYIDRLGCTSEDSIFIEEPEEILVGFNPNEIEIELGDTLFQLQPIITGAAVASFIWTPAVDLSDPLSLRPYAGNFENTTFTLVVFDSKGCSGTGSILVAVDPNRNVYLPNIFKPGNSSGINDRFNPLIGNGVEKVNFMRVYDRWGEMMYERESFVPQNDDFSEGWDGKFHGKRVNPGVYVYIVEVSFLDGRVLLYRGDVTVYN